MKCWPFHVVLIVASQDHFSKVILCYSSQPRCYCMKQQVCLWYWNLIFLLPGSTQFAFNPLTIRMLSSTPPTSIACAPSAVNQAAPHQQNRIWEREPAPLLSAQYETLSDSDDWTAQGKDGKQGKGTGERALVFWWFYFQLQVKNLPSHNLCPETSGEPGPQMKKKWWKFIWKVKWGGWGENCLWYRLFSGL